MTVGLVLGAGAAAQAATVAVDGDTVVFAAAAGEANRVTLRVEVDVAAAGARVLRFEDAGAPISAGFGCQVRDGAALCPQVGGKAPLVLLGDVGDRFEVLASGLAVGVDAGAGADEVLGGSGADTLIGGTGDDRVVAGAGDDRVDGGDGTDDLAGGAGVDAITGGAGDDRLDGGDGNDRLEGGDGADAIVGGAGADRLIAGAGNDELDGGPNDDRLEGGPGADVFRGGASDDTVSYGGSAPLTLVIDALANDGAAGEGDHIGLDIEHLVAGNGSDRIVTGGAVKTARGGPGDDRMTAGDSVQFPELYGDEGNDVMGVAGSPNRIPSVTDGPRMRGGAGDDVMTGSDVRHADMRGEDGDDRITAGDYGSEMSGGPGNDVVTGGAGGDRVTESYATPDGRDVYSAGGGQDAFHAGLANGVTISLDDVANDGRPGDGDQVRSGFEVVTADGNVTLIGNDEPNTFYANNGSATLEGRGGDDHLNTQTWSERDTRPDVLMGGDGDDEFATEAGDDLVHGGAGDDSAFTGDGRDRVYGDAGDDIIVGGRDDDALYGGAGADELWGFEEELKPAYAYFEDGSDTLECGDGPDRALIGHADTAGPDCETRVAPRQ